MNSETRMMLKCHTRAGYGLILILLALLVTGCSSTHTTSGVVPIDLAFLGVTQFPVNQKAGSLPKGPICRVAVLPFVNDSEYPQADALFDKVFTSELRNLTNYLVVQEGDILKVYQQLRALPGQVLSPEELQLVADRVDAQLLISGIVLEMSENRSLHEGVDPTITVDVQIRDGSSGDVLWTTLHRRRGIDYRKVMHFGAIHTVTGLSSQMAIEIINLWFGKGLTQCDVSPRF